MATAKKLPSGNWRVQVSTGEKLPNGKYKYKSLTAPTAREANYAALEYELKRGKLKRDPLNITVAEAMQKYIDSKDGILSPSTVRGYNTITKHYLKKIRDIGLNSLTNHMIQSAINEEAKLKSPSAAHHAFALLSAVLREFNPGMDVRVSLPVKRKIEYHYLNAAEIEILLNEIKGFPAEIPILLALWLGMRVSEICGLKWDCVDLNRNLIFIRAAMVRNVDHKYILKETPKSLSANRVLEVPSYIMEKIKPIPKTSEFVVNIDGKAIYRELQKHLKRAKLPHISFHDLRRTNASVMLALNIPDKYAMERGGWATNNTMKNVYQQTMTAERKAVDERINSYFSERLSHEKSHGE